MSDRKEIDDALARADRGIYHNTISRVEMDLAVADRRLLATEVKRLRDEMKNLEATMRGMHTELHELRSRPVIVEFQDEGHGEFSVGYDDGHVEVRTHS
jgi:hypothetical protein